MEPNILPSLCPKSSFLLNHPLHPRYLTTAPSRRFKPQLLRALNPQPTDPESRTPTTATNNNNFDNPRPETDTIEIRFRRGSRKRARQLQKPESPPRQPPAPKDWESMTLTEKATELYMGEKGLLFWLNKFAYASIFIVVGAWILFRFVGPSLGLYQLDGPPS